MTAKLAPFTADISGAARTRIAAALDAIEARDGVRILFAVESGSRAWGFPSPDSDYDVRFVYAHPQDWYLSLTPGRDVIELPIEDDLDIAGWDIRKALNLLLKPNPVLLEWLSSPVRYRWTDDTCAALTALAGRIAPARACLHHYLNLGEGQWARHVGDAPEVSYKKLFYALRPALAIRWIRHHPDTAPPMNLQALVAGQTLEADTLADIARLVEIKAQARETGTGPRLPRLDALIADAFDWARGTPPLPRPDDQTAAATDLFRRIVKDIPHG